MRLAVKGAALALSMVCASSAAGERLEMGVAGAYLAARQAAADNDYAAAAKYYHQALARDASNHAHMENALSAHLAMAEFAPAAALGAKMLETGSPSQVAHMTVVVDEALRGDFDAMIASFEGGTRVGPLVDSLLHGWALIGAERMEDGLAAFDAVAERDGLRPFALHHKALALAYMGDFAAAEEILSGRAAGAIPDNRRGLITRAMVLSQLGQNDLARAEIARVVGPALDATLSDLDRRLAAGEALPFTEVSQPAHGMAEVFYTVAAALDGEAADSYALLYSRLAEALNPAHIDALMLSADYLERLDRPGLATATYDRVPQSAPEFITAEIGRANALYTAERGEAAVEALRQLSKSHPDISTIRIKLGDTLRRLERYGEAAKAYTNGLSLIDRVDDRHWFTFFARGISHEREGNWDAAESDFRQALVMRPNQPQVLNYLGYSLVEKNMKLGEALEMIETAAELRPDNGHILDSLGWVLYRLGRYDEAVAPMEAAVELMATDPIINDHLGDVYWSVGRRTEAHFQWQRALSFGPDDEEAERIRRKLEVGLDVVLEEEGLTRIELANDEG
ncbi:MAG: tetratricopeptide repeat protein [Pseudomonadota bacterium]